MKKIILMVVLFNLLIGSMVFATNNILQTGELTEYTTEILENQASVIIGGIGTKTGVSFQKMLMIELFDSGFAGKGYSKFFVTISYGLLLCEKSGTTASSISLVNSNLGYYSLNVAITNASKVVAKITTNMILSTKIDYTDFAIASNSLNYNYFFFNPDGKNKLTSKVNEITGITYVRNSIFIGAGTFPTPTPSYALAVNGKLGAREIVVTQAAWADFVFDSSYKLRSLYDVDKFIKENKHLPDMPTEEDVKKNGANVGDVQAKLLQKIEELTLYSIELKKENDELKSDIKVIKDKLGIK